MPKSLKRLVCAIVGHDWSDPGRIDGREPYIYRAACNRCPAVIFGDWDHLEANHVWKHYRGFGS